MGKTMKTRRCQSDISKLPEEIFIKIFEFLPNGEGKKNHDLINATLVCRSWNRIIKQSGSLMDKFILRVNTDALNKKSSGDFKITRCYRHVNISMSSLLHSVTNDCSMTQILYGMRSLKNHLTTLELDYVRILPKEIEILSQCRHLHTLGIGTWYIGYNTHNTGRIEKEEQVQKYEFAQLRRLRFYHSTISLIVLKYFECKKLEVFEAFNMRPREESSYMINFINQLEQCDAISLTIPHFDGELKPKFLWHKLKIKFEPYYLNENLTDTEFSSVKSLCQASKMNATSQLEFIEFKNLDESRLWTMVLNSCRGIESLRFMFSPVPSSVKQVEIMNNLKRLSIDTAFFESDNFPKFSAELIAVTQLIIHSHSGFGKYKSTREFEQILQPFFNQIRELELPDCYVRKSKNDAQMSSELFEFEFKNLEKLKIIDSGHYCDPWHLIDPFFIKNVCRTQRLSCINVEDRCYLENNSHLKWFTELLGTEIKTCDITIKNSSRKYVNWRKAGKDERELFGRLLTKKENTFFK